jgi:hypothetical protein
MGNVEVVMEKITLNVAHPSTNELHRSRVARNRKLVTTSRRDMKVAPNNFSILLALV